MEQFKYTETAEITSYEAENALPDLDMMGQAKYTLSTSRMKGVRKSPDGISPSHLPMSFATVWAI